VPTFGDGHAVEKMRSDGESCELSRRMGTSLDMIDRTYGHLAPDAEVAELALLNSYDVGRGTRSAVR